MTKVDRIMAQITARDCYDMVFGYNIPASPEEYVRRHHLGPHEAEDLRKRILFEAYELRDALT